jgi:hypothetical protein
MGFELPTDIYIYVIYISIIPWSYKEKYFQSCEAYHRKTRTRMQRNEKGIFIQRKLHLVLRPAHLTVVVMSKAYGLSFSLKPSISQRTKKNSNA